MTSKNPVPLNARSAVVRYAIACVAVCATPVVVSVLVADAQSRLGILIAALIAVPVQVASFAMLVRLGGTKGPGFLMAWVGGFLARVLTVGVAALLSIRFLSDGAAALLVTLAALLFITLLLESRFFRAAHLVA